MTPQLKTLFLSVTAASSSVFGIILCSSLTIGLITWSSQSDARPPSWCYRNTCKSHPEKVCAKGKFSVNTIESICSRTYNGITHYNDYGPSQASCTIVHDGHDRICGNGDDLLFANTHMISRRGVCPTGETWSESLAKCIHCKGIIENGLCIQQRASNACASTPNPIDLTSGLKYLKEQDVHGIGRFPLSFTRYYRHTSTRSVTNVFTYWSMDYTQRFVSRPTINSDERVGALTRADGEIYYFRSTDGEVWTPRLIGDKTDISPEYDNLNTLIGYRVRYIDNVAEHYDLEGLLTRIEKPGGHIETLHYAMNEWNHIASITVRNPLGDELTIDFAHPLADPERTNHDFTLTTPDGQRFIYTFSSIVDPSPTLTVTYPDNTAETEDNPTRQYVHYSAYDPTTGTVNEYRHGGITEIRDNGNVFLRYEYDPVHGRAILSEKADGAERDSLSYLFNDQSQVVQTFHTNALGKETVYHFAHLGGRQLMTQVAGHASENCAAANQYTSYYPDGTVQTTTDWNGNVTYFERDSRGRETLKVEGYRWIGDTPHYGVVENVLSLLDDPGQLVTTKTCWHSEFNLPVRVIEANRVAEMEYTASGQLISRSIKPRSTSNESCL